MIGNMIKYKLIDESSDKGDYTNFNRPTCDDWEAAAEQAVQLGVGRWKNSNEFTLDFPYVIKVVRVWE